MSDRDRLYRRLSACLGRRASACLAGSVRPAGHGGLTSRRPTDRPGASVLGDAAAALGYPDSGLTMPASTPMPSACAAIVEVVVTLGI